MSNTIKITTTDPGKPSITDESYTKVQSENEGRGDTSNRKPSGYESSFFFVFIAVIVLVATILLMHNLHKNGTYKYQNQDGTLKYKRIIKVIMYILTLALCVFIIISLGAVHWAFKIAILVPFGFVLVGLGYFLFIIWIFIHLK